MFLPSPEYLPALRGTLNLHLLLFTNEIKVGYYLELCLSGTGQTPEERKIPPVLSDLSRLNAGYYITIQRFRWRQSLKLSGYIFCLKIKKKNPYIQHME